MRQTKLLHLAIIIIFSGCTTATLAPNKQTSESKAKVEDQTENKVNFPTLVKEFGDNTQVVLDKINILLTTNNSAQLNADIARLASSGRLIDPKKPTNDLKPEALDLKSIPSDTNKGSSNSYYLEGEFVSADDITIGIEALSKYGTVLSSLATVGSKTDIEMASANLYGAALKVDEAYQKLEGGQPADDSKKSLASTVSTVIAKLGTFYTAYRRNEALKDIIIVSEPKIKVITTTLTEGLNKANLASSVYFNRQQLFNINQFEYNYQITSRPTPLAWRENEIKRLIELKSQIATSDTDMVNVNNSLTAVAEAHTSLFNAVSNKDKKFNATDLIEKIKVLKATVENTKSYREMLLKCKSGKFKTDDSGSIICQDAS